MFIFASGKWKFESCYSPLILYYQSKLIKFDLFIFPEKKWSHQQEKEQLGIKIYLLKNIQNGPFLNDNAFWKHLKR